MPLTVKPRIQAGGSKEVVLIEAGSRINAGSRILDGVMSYLTYYLNHRKGPNKPRIMAMAVPIGDAGKLFSKEEKLIIRTNKKHYSLCPITIIILSLLL